jgi:hypothetical protein
MDWVKSIIDIYWEMRPCDKTQQAYKSKGLKAADYWNLELEYLTKSVWIKDDEFRSLKGIDYLLHKYPGETVVLDELDRKMLKIQFLYDLGMDPSVFLGEGPPLHIEDLS